MKACILTAVEVDPQGVAEHIGRLSGVVEAFPVLRRREVVIRAQVRDMNRLADLLDRVTAVRGVIVSETLLEIPQVVR